MAVQIPCICPPKADGEQRHPQGDSITLRATLPFRDAAAIRYALGTAVREDPDLGIPEFLAICSEFFILGGIESWTLQGEDGKPLPVLKQHIRELLLSKPDVAYTVGDAGDDLYTQAVVLPLFQTDARSSLPTQTEDSISAKTSFMESQQMPSKPSLITTSQTDDIEETSLSLAGVSS